jgi:hypothetical protein
MNAATSALSLLASRRLPVLGSVTRSKWAATHMKQGDVSANAHPNCDEQHSKRRQGIDQVAEGAAHRNQDSTEPRRLLGLRP